MAGPKPATAQQEAEEKLDEMEDADIETPDGTVSREEATGADPFDDTDDAGEVELDLADVDVGDPVDETGPEPEDSPFDETDHADLGGDQSTSDRQSASGAFDGSPGDDPFASMESAGSTAIADNINAGAARLAVVGLQDEFLVNGKPTKKDDLQDEFEEVFETFRLGHYGAEAAEEYLLIDDEEVDPLMAFTASMILCTGMVVWLRPDSDEIADSVKAKMAGLQT